MNASHYFVLIKHFSLPHGKDPPGKLVPGFARVTFAEDGNIVPMRAHPGYIF